MRTSTGILVLAAAPWLFLAEPTVSDMFAPSHDCYAPSRPYEPDEWEWRNFLSEAEQFRQCIEEFVEEQDDAIRRHRDAAEEAISEWESFEATELS